MEAKVFELRDRGTFIPLLAVKAPTSPDSREDWLLSQAGWSSWDVSEGYILIIGSLSNGRYSQDPNELGDSRTFSVAHTHIMANWDSLKNGQVICIEHIMGERAAPRETGQWGGGIRAGVTLAETKEVLNAE